MTNNSEVNEKEEQAIEELRKRMKGDMEEDLYEDIKLFYRFLKVCNFNVKNAEQMLRKHLEWRERNDVRNIFNYDMPEVILKYFPYIFLGYDKEGSVIRYSPIGNLDFNGLYCSIKYDQLEKLMIYFVEDDERKIKMQSEKLGRSVDQSVFICNLEHLTFKKVTDRRAVQCAISILTTYQNNYPERVKVAYVINGSIYLTFVYNILKSILSSSILSKIHLYHDDSWKEDILKVVDADVLPAFLGGARTDPDGNPLCLTFINHGEPVPEKYYIHRSKRSLATMDGVKKVTLANAAFHEEKLEVEIPGSCLEWEFETKCRDIGFGLFYEDVSDGEEKMIEIIPHQRIDTEEYSEVGTYICEKAGTYVFLFDNSYSWIRSKEIYYRITIVTPKEQAYRLQPV